MADYARDWSVYPVGIGPVSGEFRKSLRVRRPDGDAFDFSARFGFDGGAGRLETGVRNVHRPTGGASLRSRLCSLDVMLDLSRIRRVPDQLARDVLGFTPLDRIGLWELPGARARVFVDPITLIEQLVTPDAKLAPLLLSPFMEFSFETVVDEDEFIFRSSSKPLGDFLDLRNNAYPRSFGLARCLAYWLGSRGRARELQTLVTSLLDADAPLSLPSMFGTAPIRLTCVVENSHYIVLQMQSLVHGAYWPRLFDRMRLEDAHSGLALNFREQAANSATLMWWGPCNVEVGAARCVPSTLSDSARTGVFMRHEGNEVFWPTFYDQGANRTVLLLDGLLFRAPATHGEMPPYLQPMGYATPDGLPLHHRKRVLAILLNAPAPLEVAKIVAECFDSDGRGVRHGVASEKLNRRNAGIRDSDAAKSRLRNALQDMARSSEWEPKAAQHFDVSLPSVLEWAVEIGPQPNRQWKDGLSSDINVVDPLFVDSLPVEAIDALRALTLRGAKAYGFAVDRWGETRIRLLAFAVGFPRITDREVRLCTQAEAPFLADNDLRQILGLADQDSSTDTAPTLPTPAPAGAA